MDPTARRQEAFELIRSYLIDQFEIEPAKISFEANLFTDLELDSIDALDMVAVLESRLKMKIKNDELKKMRLVGDVVDYILRHTS